MYVAVGYGSGSIHEYLFVYVLINYNVTYNLILFLIVSWTYSNNCCSQFKLGNNEGDNA